MVFNKKTIDKLYYIHYDYVVASYSVTLGILFMVII